MYAHHIIFIPKLLYKKYALSPSLPPPLSNSLPLYLSLSLCPSLPLSLYLLQP